VTLTFNIHQSAGQPQAWAYLDEISLGSTFPDVWVTQTGSAASALPGDALRLSVAYGNRGHAQAGDVRLTEVLGPGLSFIAADPPPTDIAPWPTWEIGDLPPGSGSLLVVITATVAVTTPFPGEISATATIETGTPELETENNAATLPIAVATRLYLPLVHKRSQ